MMSDSFPCSVCENQCDDHCIQCGVVGEEGTSKHEFSKSLVDLVAPYRVHVHTCKCLPVPRGSHVYNVNIDFICFILHQANKGSLTAVQDSLGQVDVSYFLGRSAIIVNTKGERHDESIHPKSVEALGKKYGIPVLFTDIEDQVERTDLTRKIRNLVEIACGLKNNLSSLFI